MLFLVKALAFCRRDNRVLPGVTGAEYVSEVSRTLCDARHSPKERTVRVRRCNDNASPSRYCAVNFFYTFNTPTSDKVASQ